MCLCMYLCVCAYAYVCVSVCACICVCVCVYVCVYMCLCVYIFVCVHVYMCVYVCDSLCMCLCVYVYVLACLCMYMCVHTCTACVCTKACMPVHIHPPSTYNLHQQGLSLVWNSGWLASEPQVSSCLCLHSAKVPCMPRTFHRLLGIEGKHFTSLSFLPSPLVNIWTLCVSFHEEA